jgi:hypothetical protein
MNSNYFSRNLINSIGNSFKQVMTEDSLRAAEARARNDALGAENKARAEARRNMKAEFQADLAKERQGRKDPDEFEIRKAVSDRWAADPEKQKRASELGLGALGQVKASQSSGSFGYRHASYSDAKHARNEAENRWANEQEPKMDAAQKEFQNRIAQQNAQQTPPPTEPRRPYVNPNSPEGRIAASGENYGLNNPESPYFDREASIRRQQEAEANVARVQQQAAASLPAARAAEAASRAKLNLMQGRFGRPVPSIRNRIYPIRG